jgi:hypothetical protein
LDINITAGAIMKIGGFKVPIRMAEQTFAGLLLSYITVLMKCNKAKNAGPLQHFYRERLGKRADRAALNAMLNAFANQTARKAGKKPRRTAMYESVEPLLSEEVICSTVTLNTELETVVRRKAFAAFNDWLDTLDKLGAPTPSKLKQNEVINSLLKQIRNDILNKITQFK